MRPARKHPAEEPLDEAFRAVDGRVFRIVVPQKVKNIVTSMPQAAAPVAIVNAAMSRSSSPLNTMNVTLLAGVAMGLAVGKASGASETGVATPKVSTGRCECLSCHDTGRIGARNCTSWRRAGAHDRAHRGVRAGPLEVSPVVIEAAAIGSVSRG